MERARLFLHEQKYMRKMLCKSRLNRRMHAIPLHWWNELLGFVKARWIGLNSRERIVDTFPIAACRNIRIQRSRLFQGEHFRGYNASKREYFYGLKAMVITTRQGYPLQFAFAPGSEHDATLLKHTPLESAEGCTIYGDAAYIGDCLAKVMHAQGTRLVAQQRSNSLKPMSVEDWVQLRGIRKRIETTFSQITQWMPRAIQAVSPQGFELKLAGFIVAYGIHFILNQ